VRQLAANLKSCTGTQLPASHSDLSYFSYHISSTDWNLVLHSTTLIPWLLIRYLLKVAIETTTCLSHLLIRFRVPVVDLPSLSLACILSIRKLSSLLCSHTIGKIRLVPI
jgi:hypothetical protein